MSINSSTLKGSGTKKLALLPYFARDHSGYVSGKLELREYEILYTTLNLLIF